jgi:hypothetical protein
MKKILNLAVVTCIALATSSSVFAKAKKATLADFKGSYSGTVSLSANGMPIGSGPLALTFAAKKTGKTGSINTSGSISVGGNSIPVTAAISLNKGAFSIDNFVFNTLAQGSYPGLGSYTVGKKTISFQGSATVSGNPPTTYTFSGSIVSKTKGRTQTLTFTTVELISGANYTFVFTVSRHLKKSEVTK